MSTKLQGVLLVLLGSMSYGLPASLMKISESRTLSEADILFFQFLFGSLCLGMIYYFTKIFTHDNAKQISLRSKSQLMLSGLSIALTNSFYLASLHYVSVAVAAVLLMQSVWISSVLDFFIKKNIPGLTQIICIVIVLLGTILTTEIYSLNSHVSLIGLSLGLASGISYAITILVTNTVALNASAYGRAYYVSLGAFIFIFLYWGASVDINSLFLELEWGLVIAFFSIVFPLLMFTIGMPKITAGVGGIITAIELPASVVFAYFLLREQVGADQLIGISLILMSIVFSNFIKSTKLGHV